MNRSNVEEELNLITSSLVKRVAGKNGRCHLHCGKSTGAKIQEGKLRQKMAPRKYSHYSKEAPEERGFIRQILKDHRDYLSHIPI